MTTRFRTIARLFRLVPAALVLAACATSSLPRSTGALSSGADGSQRWEPGPNAQRALAAVWAAKPFGAPASVVAEASGGKVARTHETEILLYEENERVDDSGRSVSIHRTVFRYQKDSPDRTLTFRWAPWREERPVVRARVISAEGEESPLDMGAAVEGVPSVDGLELTDIKAIGIPLPNARVGSVVEVQVTRVSTRPLLPGGGELRSYRLWSFSPVRKMRISAEVPASVPLVIEAEGVAVPPIARSGGRQRFELEIGELQFKPFKLTRDELAVKMPHLTWSTGRSWEDVAQRYRALLESALGDRVDLSSLAPLAAGATTPTQKVQAVLRWLSDRVRYTAVHLGEGAILPTQPSKVLARGYGDCKDLAVLATIALRSLGLRAEVAAIAADDDLPSETAAGLAAFNHMIVAVSDGTKTLWVDATAPRYPAGVLPFADRNQRALIIAPGTRGLAPTPRHSETPFIVRQKFDLEFAAFDAGKASVTFESAGAAEAVVRSGIETCDDATARKLAEGPMHNMFGEVPFAAQLRNCTVGSGPLVLTAQLGRAERVGTGDLSASVTLVSRVLDAVVDEQLHGPAPGSDQRTSEMKADQQKRIQEELGLSEDDFNDRSYSFDSRPDIERVYRLKAPPRFAAENLPPDRIVQLGPARFTESYTTIDGSTVEVRFRFESDKTELTVEDVKRFREAYWKRWSEPATEINFVYEPLKLLHERKPEAAVALMKKWSQDAPSDGLTRARTAALLLQLDLVDLARVEADRAVKDAPEEPVVLAVRGNIARYDDKGRLFEIPFERGKAIEYLKKALARAPNHNWLARTLTDMLRRNEWGEVDRVWSSDAAEGAALLEKLVDAKEAGKSVVELLVEMYVENRRVDALKRLIEKRPDIIDDDESGAVEALTGGVEAVTRRLDSIQEPKDRLQHVARSYDALAQAGRYQEADALVEKFDGGPAVATELGMLRAYAKGVHETPATPDLTSPEAAARSISAMFAHATGRVDAAARLAKLASIAGKAELGTGPEMFNFMRLPAGLGSSAYDHLYYRGECQVSGSKTLARVRCQSPVHRKLVMTSYWVMEGGGLKLESIGKPSQAAARAWQLALGRRNAEAGQWIDWLIEELQARDNRGLSSSLLQDAWSQPGGRTGEGLTLAAALTWFVFTDVTKDAPQAAVDALKNARSRLSGALKRRADEALATVYESRGDYASAVRTLEPLAASENEPRLWRRLASLEYNAGQYAKAMARTLAALKSDPGNADWRQIKALVEMRSGKYDASIETLKKLAADKGDAVDIRNNLAWAQLMAGHLSEDLERDVLQLTSDKNASEYALHTGAMVLLERGRLTEASEANARRHRALDNDKDEASWLFRARLLQFLGYEAASRIAYAKVVKDPELVDFKKRASGKAVAHR